MKLEVKRKRRQSLVERKSLRRGLTHFIKTTPGFNKKSYGEICFKDFGTRFTYSAFITCSPSTNPEDVIRLMREFWNLSVPNIVISVAGNFNRYDNSWQDIMDNTWIITNGTSPAQATSYACLIAIVEIGAVANNGVLYSLTNEGLFPAEYTSTKISGQGRRLDFAHTHFIFVQGDAWQTLEFRENLLSYIATIPIEMDASFTEFLTTPVLIAMVSEETDAMLHITGKCAEKHPVVVTPSAGRVAGLLSEVNIAREMDELDHYLSSDDYARRVKSLCSSVPVDLDRQRVEDCVKGSLLSRKDVITYPCPERSCLNLAVLHGVIANGKSSFRSRIRLALAWNKMDVIRQLVPSREVFQKEEDVYMVYLTMALTLDRSEFLEYLMELGINLWSTLTVKTLWTLYYKPLFKEGFETRVSPTLHGLVNDYGDAKTQLLRHVGKAINILTRFQVSELYSGPTYQYFDAAEITDLQKRATTMISQIDDSPPVPHPERDLFFWSLLMGKGELALLFWKGGHSLMASSIVASAITRSQAVMLDNTLQGSDVAESLYDESNKWADNAVEFLTTSYKLNRSSTLCQLTQKIEQLGGCSVLNLAYVCKHREFIAQPAVQTALDYIWYGMTKQEQPLYKVVITLICPIAVPCLSVIERKDVFTTDMSQTYRSVYTEDANGMEQNETEEGIGGVLSFIEKWGTKGEVTTQRKTRNRLVTAMRDTYDYFNSPRVKFLVHSMILSINIILLSYYIISQDYYVQRYDPAHFAVSIILCSYFVGLAVDEVRQITTIESATLRGKLKSWAGSPWNKMDLVLVTCYFTGQGIMWSSAFGDNLWYAGKIFLCIALFAMYIRCFQVYLVFKYFGPKVYMMRRMLKDLVIFLSIMGLIFLSYGVILLSVNNYPNPTKTYTNTLNITSVDTFLLSVYNNIIRVPYWQLYGNELGNATVAQNSYGIVSALLTCFYMLFSNILMLNLLIAMFSYTFQTIEDRAGIFWSYHRFDVVEEFCDRPWLPAPFVILEDIARFINICRNGPVGFSAFRKKVSEEQETELYTFEQHVLQKMMKKKEEEDKDEHLMTMIVEQQQELQLQVKQLLNLEKSRKSSKLQKVTSCPITT